MEEWRDIKGFEGKYMVSNLGRVKSLNYKRTGKERILKGRKDGSGYLQVILCKDGIKKDYKVHQLVGNAFLSNPQGYKELNHKDEDKTNNCADNLEWCSRSYNMNYGTRAEKTYKPVLSVDKESGLIMWWESIREAEKCTGISHQNICHCLKGRQKSAGGFYWYYSNADTEE